MNFVIDKYFNDKICPICKDFQVGLVSIISCDHSYHRDCISEWIRYGNKTCPYCRSEIKF